MEPDPIIEEIHAIREALSKASGDDIRKTVFGQDLLTGSDKKSRVYRENCGQPM